MEDSASIFSAQHNKHQWHNKDIIPDITPAVSQSQILTRGKLQKVETLFEDQIQAAHNLGNKINRKIWACTTFKIKSALPSPNGTEFFVDVIE